MAKKFKLKRSNVITNGVPKIPTKSTGSDDTGIDYGEIALNYGSIRSTDEARDLATLTTLDANGNVIALNQEVYVRNSKHGTTSSNDENFVSEIKPKIVIDSDGVVKYKNNKGEYNEIAAGAGIAESVDASGIINDATLTVKKDDSTSLKYEIDGSNKTIKLGDNLTASLNENTLTINATDTNTDTSVTSVDNHYTPSKSKTLGDSTTTTLSFGNAVVVGAEADAKGHITALVTRNLPSDPNTHYTSDITVSTSNSTSNSAVTKDPYLNHIENNSPTSAHQIKGTGSVTVSSDASGNITISGTDTNTHYTSKNIVGSSTTATSNSAVTNPYLNHFESNSTTPTSTHKITGSGSVTVSSDASGNITISGTDTDTHYTSKNVFASTNSDTTEASTNNPYLNHVENSTIRSTHQFKGDDYIKINSDSSNKAVNFTLNTANLDSRISSVLGDLDAMRFKGTVGTGGTVTTLPTTDVNIGDTYKVLTAGTYDGNNCEVGDLIIAIATTPSWTVAQANIDGAVTGPTSSNSDTVAIFNGTTGKVIKDSGFTIGKSVPSDAVFTDHNTTYTLSASGSVITLTPNSGESSTVTLDGGTDISLSTSDNKITINHDIKSTTSTSAGTLTHGSSTVISAITTDNGHITGYKYGTLPSSYSLPIAKYATLGGIKPNISWTTAATLTTTATSKSTTAPTIQAVGTDSDRYYAIEVDSNGRAFVNVPWKDTNTDTSVTSVDNHYEPKGTDTTDLDSSTGTLSFGGQVVVGANTDAKGHITSFITNNLPSNPNTDTHYTSKNIVGSSTTATSNSKVSTNPYLNHIENNTVRSTHQIKGSGSVTVSSDASGNITISGTDTDTHYTSDITVGTSNSTSNSAVTKDPYLNHIENNSAISAHQIKGSGSVTVSSDTSGNITISDKAIYTYLTSNNVLSDLTNITSTCKLATYSTSSSPGGFSISSMFGTELHIIVTNTSSSSSITIPFSNSSSYIVLGDDTLTIDANSYGEINVIKDPTTSKYYIRSIS